ncbi:MAG TPA: sulfotransferase [Lacipirellulaceae bacterium]|nr:sulfotransferase [Lacipirellulaceae bacterium]
MPPVRSLLHRYVPAQLHDPVGLAMRLLRTGDPAALFAMATAAGGLAAAPLDMALALPERRLLAAADPTAPAPPLIFVCGAPRSGTTVAYQTLVNHLPVAYFSNLAALFPRAPLTAQRLFGRMAGQAPVDYHSFYGRTRGLAGPNDALFLWDRWLGADRTAAPAEPPSDRLDAMRRFFAACAGQFQRPLANKNNSLNLSAHWIAPALPQATFICMTRERRQLARSLYHARCDIHGSPQAA